MENDQYVRHRYLKPDAALSAAEIVKQCVTDPEFEHVIQWIVSPSKQVV